MEHTYIKFDQAALHAQRAKQDRYDRNWAIVFGLALVIVGISMLYGLLSAI